MGKVTGFKEFDRQVEAYRPIAVRLTDYDEIFSGTHDEAQLITQGARCMDCGVPFCQSDDGCPIDNLIPEFNDLVYQDRWFEAYQRLIQTNNFPEFTGRVCPAPCEGACVLGINSPAVTIKNIELAIIDKAFDAGWVQAEKAVRRHQQTIAIVGSGPAGLAAADMLNQMGYLVSVFERDDRIGGLLMYGIPNMKLAKNIVTRRVDLLRQAGVVFHVNSDVGKTMMLSELQQKFDAVLLTTGATKARDLPIEGRHLSGIHFAMDYLRQSTKQLLANKKQNSGMDANSTDANGINASGKNVIVIGGGDTGTDCIATAIREGARSIVNFELMTKPPQQRGDDNPWPQWPLIYQVDYGHQEARHLFGQDIRNYQLMTERFFGDDNGQVTGLETMAVTYENGQLLKQENSQKHWQADLVLLAMGFVSPEHYATQALDITLDKRQNYQADYNKHHTNVDGIFAAGDCRRGQSLVVWAIDEGRRAATNIDNYLQKSRAD